MLSLTILLAMVNIPFTTLSCTVTSFVFVISLISIRKMLSGWLYSSYGQRFYGRRVFRERNKGELTQIDFQCEVTKGVGTGIWIFLNYMCDVFHNVGIHRIPVGDEVLLQTSVTRNLGSLRYLPQFSRAKICMHLILQEYLLARQFDVANQDQLFSYWEKVRILL